MRQPSLAATCVVIHDMTGSYKLAFVLAIACCVISAMAIWIAAPAKCVLFPAEYGAGDSDSWDWSSSVLARDRAPARFRYWSVVEFEADVMLNSANFG
jgi:hypothetical protein